MDHVPGRDRKQTGGKWLRSYERLLNNFQSHKIQPLTNNQKRHQATSRQEHISTKPPRYPTLKTTNKPRPSSSAFLNLPLEVRLEIYRHLLGHHIFHLIRLHPDTRRRLIAVSNSSQYRIDDSALSLARDLIGVQEKRLQPLLTCRQVYHEAIDILYQDNIFDIHDLQSLFDLHTTVPRKKFASIRILRVSWSLDELGPESCSHWIDFCSLVASEMQGLQELHFDLLRGFLHSRRASMGLDSAWVAAIMRIRQVRRVRLRIHCCRRDDLGLLEETKALQDYLHTRLQPRITVADDQEVDKGESHRGKLQHASCEISAIQYERLRV